MPVTWRNALRLERWWHASRAINGFVKYEPIHSRASQRELSESENSVVDWRIDEIGTSPDGQ
jgi:hypothetical protein